MNTSSSRKNHNFKRAIVPVLRLSQVFLVFSAVWFIYWAHIYEITVWNKTFTETLSSTRNIAAYIISVLVLVQLEYEARQLKHDKQITTEKPESLPPKKKTGSAIQKTNSKIDLKNAEYLHAAEILHKAGKPINEENLNAVLIAAGINPDPARVKAFVANLKE